MMNLKRQITFISYFIVIQISFGQDAKITGTKLIDSYLSNGEFVRADSALQQQIARLKSQQLTDSLIDYIYYIGKVKLKLSNTSQATKAVTEFTDGIKASTVKPRLLRQLYLELGSFYNLIGNPQKAYESNLTALDYTVKIKNATGEDFGLVHSNMGTYAKYIGNLHLALQHHRKALKYYESWPGTEKSSLYITYNSLGGMMWFSSKIDSALYYYKLAGSVLKKLPQTPLNKYFRPAMLNNNIAAIYGSQGNMEKAMQSMKSTINNWISFLNSEASDDKKESGKNAYYQAIENYAGLYKDLGDYQKAKDLLSYAYHEKLKSLDADNPELFKSKILLGQIYLALKEYKLADEYLDAGIAHIASIPGAFYFWDADAHYYKATANEALGKTEIAARYYAQAQILYDKALQGAYDEIYLEFIIKASYFYAKSGERDKALEMAHKAYDYIVENQGEKTMFEFQQVLNLGEIYYVLGDYEQALMKSNGALNLLKDRMYSGDTALDSVFILFEKPQAVLLKVKSAFHLTPETDTVFLKGALDEMQEALTILERRKPFLGDNNNLSVLIADNNSIFEFAKTLALELFKQTGNEAYLNIIFGMHESSLYNRIRSRLGIQVSMSYKDLPEEILAQEKSLKSALRNALNQQNGIDAFFVANIKWKYFLNTLKRDYPEYYRLQYASIAESEDNIWQEVPGNTTVVRYVFISDSLFVLVFDGTSKYIFKLHQDDLAGQIAKAISDSISFEEVSDVLRQLYNSLWKPIENRVKTKRVIIIPDRELFNLSFEILTPEPITSCAGLAENSLLSRHSIAYEYSLLLVNHDKRATKFSNNFVAFVPEFNDKMKEDYKISIADSLLLDKTYLTLLPQPFSLSLAKASVRLFDGKSFLNGQSTKQIFMNSAGEHKIIHIGTHAESNNLSPELSRLVFAKPLKKGGSEEDNSLFVYEIYNCNLSSNLAILTACETGKPTWQPGEGMISLAHAFHYAGSQSILTSLWKIDEKSSSQIVKLFYDRLSAGLPKDKALQQAKLEYLKTENGRALSPKYWAGLILIGDTSSVPISSSRNWLLWLSGVLVLSGLVVYLIMRRLL